MVFRNTGYEEKKIIGNFLEPCAYKGYDTQTKKGSNYEK